MSSWWDDFTGVFKQGLSGQNIGTLLGTGIAGYAIDKSGLSSPNIPVVGYQGEVPKYTAVRERVPMQQDPNRRPGSGGRRYFSDMIYADRPERQPMSVAQARTQAQQQAQGIAALQKRSEPKNQKYLFAALRSGLVLVLPLLHLHCTCTYLPLCR